MALHSLVLINSHTPKSIRSVEQNQYIWKGKSSRVQYKTLQLKKDKGDQGLPCCVCAHQITLHDGRKWRGLLLREYQSKLN